MSEERTIYITNAGSPAIGLTPNWQTLKKVSDGTDVLPQPTISEIGGGFYRFTVDVPVDEQWCGVIDAGSNISINAERYIPVLLNDNDLRKNTICVVTPVYDESSDTLQMFVFLLRNGEVVSSSQLDSASVSVYDSTHSLQFTVTGTASTNGVFMLAKNTPGLTSGEGYYMIASIVVGSKTFNSVETMLILD